jgi:hydroxymethylbilane synthase
VHPDVEFETTLLETRGDLDLLTSLRQLEKTDFFTREIEERQLAGEFDVSIHSAKDLPERLSEGLKVIALTRGVDPADVLVIKEGMQFEMLPSGARIGTSSERREQNLRALRSDLVFADIRGPVQERLAMVERGEFDGVVVAEAALIRLGLTHLNRMVIPGERAALQGQLAIVAREGDWETERLFLPLDVR